MNDTWPPAVSAQALLAAIVESSDDAIISKDLDGTITSWNNGAERLFGYTAAEAVGQPVTILIPEDRLDEEPSILGRVRAGQRVDHYETVRRRKDGTLVDISLTVSPIRDGLGRVMGASKIARDITERKESAARAERARQEAESANRAKDEFLAMLGHELRNPLSAVRNATAAAVLDPVNRDRALEIARRQTDQLTRIVDDLLDVARITRGRVPLRKERVWLGDVIQRSVDGARALMEEHGQTLMLLPPREPVQLEADPGRLEQAISNLLTNAAKYSDPGGTVTVTAQTDGTEVVIAVRDQGIGIPPETLPTVFELFSQGQRSLDRGRGGLGIGLTLARRIVELHGGTVEARSAGLGKGAEFVIRLPGLSALQPGAIEAPEPLAGGLRREAQPSRVLVVEDNPDAAESLMMILEVLGHHVRVVYDGRAALEAARANLPDIMLIDIGLPGMNGYELAQAIRGEATLARIILVALTGYGRSEDKAQALAAGFDYHLVKPVDLQALGDLVARPAEGRSSISTPGVN
jgi:PAS domain S-box-containing protein